MTLVDTLSLVMTVLFLLAVLSYYLLLFLPAPHKKKERSFSSVTVIVPAHNEEPYIEACLDSLLAARFHGEKEIIVVDDGSKDRTGELVARYRSRGVVLLHADHIGKSAAINKALSQAKGEAIAIVDGDSVIASDALARMSLVLGQENNGGATGVVKVANRTKYISLWMHIEQLYNSLMRLLFSKINANVTTPGPLSMYRKDALLSIGGFSTEGFSEDVDVTIRLIRRGYHVGFAPDALASTNMPYDPKGFLRQRTRFARGLVNILKRHMQLNSTIIDIYTLPLFLFTYIQAIIMGSITLYQVISGYLVYFVDKGIYFNMQVFLFFFEWFSIVGFFRWMIDVFSGASPLTMLAAVGIASTLLSYPLYLVAIFRFDRRFDVWHLIPIVFMAPFWLLIMVIYILCSPEYFRKEQYNIWKKNE